jgi:hypothetical protein
MIDAIDVQDFECLAHVVGAPAISSAAVRGDLRYRAVKADGACGPAMSGCGRRRGRMA